MSTPELCFCGRPLSTDSAWFCSDVCARQDSLNTLLGLPSSSSQRSPSRSPRPRIATNNKTNIGLPSSPSPARSPSTVPSAALQAETGPQSGAKPPGWKSHYRTVEARRAAERRRDVSKTKSHAQPATLKQASASGSHDRKSSLSSSASRVSTIFSRPDTAHSSGSSLAPRSPPMTANSDNCVVEEGDESSFATCIDDEWAAIEALHGGDASSFDEHGSGRKQHLSAKQMSNLQQRTVAELFEEIARAKQLTPWGTSIDSPSSSEFPFPARPDCAESETDLDVLNDDALAPFMGTGNPKCTTRDVLDPAVTEDADLLSEPREPVRIAFPQSQPPRARQPSSPPAASQQQPETGGQSASARHCQPAPVAAARTSRSPLERFSATVLPVRRQASKPTLPRHQEFQEVSFLPHSAGDTATPRLPHKSRSSALLRLPATLGRGLSRAGDKLRSRMSSLPGAQAPPVLPVPPQDIEPSMEPSTSVLEIGASGSTATITGPRPSASLLPAFPPVPVASTSARHGSPAHSPTLSRPKSFHERQSPARRSVLADANAAYLLLRVPKMPPRAGAFPSTPSPFRSPATGYPPSPASSRPSSHHSDRRPESSSSLLSPPSPICTRSVEDVRRLSNPDSPTVEFYRDRPLPPLPPARSPGSGKLRLGQVMAMRAHSQTAALRRVGSASTVMPPRPPRIVVHPYASAGVRAAAESEESSADESDADEVVDVVRRMRMHSPPRYAGLGLSLPATPLSARRRAIVDAL